MFTWTSVVRLFQSGKFKKCERQMILKKKKKKKKITFLTKSDLDLFCWSLLCAVNVTDTHHCRRTSHGLITQKKSYITTLSIKYRQFDFYCSNSKLPENKEILTWNHINHCSTGCSLPLVMAAIHICKGPSGKCVSYFYVKYFLYNLLTQTSCKRLTQIFYCHQKNLQVHKYV